MIFFFGVVSSIKEKETRGFGTMGNSHLSPAMLRAMVHEGPQWVELPKDTVLYRARRYNDPTEPLAPNQCDETGKIGLYFADCVWICMGMALEQKCDVVVHEYRVVDSIDLVVGKYSFRQIHPERYYDKQGNFILNVDTLESENVSHIDADADPDLTEADSDRFGRLFEGCSEIFVAKRDLNGLEFVRKGHRMTPAECRERMTAELAQWSPP